MNNRTAFLIFAVLMIILLVCIAAVSNPAWTMGLLSVAFVLLLILGPFKLAEDFFDLIDKYIDGYIDQSKNLHWKWHGMYLVVVGLIFFVVWPSVAIFLIDNDHLLLHEWYRYFRPVDETPTWLFGYPRYAYEFGLVGLVTSIVGYVVEAIGVLVTGLVENRWKRGA